MKKKILIVNHQMQLGGVCIAVKNFIENMKGDYELEYMLAKPNGELDNRMPKDIKVSYIPYPLCVASMNKKECKMRGVKYFFRKATIKVLFNFFNRDFVIKKLCKQTKKNINTYDFIINNDMDMSKKNFGACHVYTKNLVEAPMKVLVVHGDFIANKYDPVLFKSEFIPSYNYIVLLSNALKQQMIDLFPESSEKFITIPNFCAVDEIKTMSNEFEVMYNDNTLNIVSASRLTELKGFMRSLKVFKMLKEEGFNFCWNILGEGEQRSEIERYVKENGLENNVKLWGLKNNPYPYMKSADLLYLGSYHESYGLVLIESMIVGKPVLTTKTASAEEIVDANYGWICGNSEEGIYNAFREILLNPDEIKEKTNNLKNYNYDNESIKEKYDKLIGR